MKAYHKEKIWFRIVGLPIRLLPSLEAALPDDRLETGRHNKTGRLVVSIKLNQKTNYKELLKFLRHNKIKPTKYGLWISLVTERDSDGVRVPDFAVKLFRKIGGHLDFSFTAVGEDQNKQNF